MLIVAVYSGPLDVYTNLPLALTAGEGAPDICLVKSSHLGEYVHLSGFLDLTDKVAPHIDIMNDYRWFDAEKDGKYYALPWDSGPVVLYYRAERNRRGLWAVLREEYSPALFEAVTHNVAEFQPGQEVTTEVAIKSRRSIETEIPAYTLEGYTLHWELLEGKLLLTGGDLEIPTLQSGESWRGSLTWTVPEEQPFTLTL